VRPEGFIPPYIEKELAGRFRDGADVISCMFALHYFFASAETFDGFLKNLAENLKIGGYFIGCCFDGERVFEFLRGRTVRQGIDREGDPPLWTMTKKYEADDIPPGDEAFGLPVDVNFISIGQEHREYIVPFGLLVEKMRSIGCELLDPEELKAVGLANSTAMFERSHEMAERAGRRFPLTPANREFSFLNRWFIFRRKGEIGVDVSAAPKEIAVATALPPAATLGAALGEAEAADAAEVVAEEVRAAREGEEAAAAAASSAAGMGGPAGGPRVYAAAEVVQFSQQAAAMDRLKIGDKYAQRWMAPGSYFEIADPTDTAKKYPSVEHFMAAMKYKIASDKPGLADGLFGYEGTIHQKFARQRAAEIGVGVGAKQLTPDRDADLLTEEVKEIRAETTQKGMKARKAAFNEAKWEEVKDDLLREALRQRFERDARFRKIIEAAKAQKKTLLFYTGSASSEWGGKMTRSGNGVGNILEGENKIGRFLMELADYTA
jgi:predicted NAD-dependent protein-ADP-ribosyltransferase YbiA (DUF1768 family)